MEKVLLTTWDASLKHSISLMLGEDEDIEDLIILQLEYWYFPLTSISFKGLSKIF